MATQRAGAALGADERAADMSNERSLVQLHQLQSRARSHVNEAIGAIPNERKQAYMEAVGRAPELVATETDPLQFVRFCQYNVWNAAERLVLYWKERKEAFGPERFCLPLTLTGDGALTHSDVLSLRAGFPAILPDTASGEHQVVIADRRQHLRTADNATRLRCIFYVCGVLAKDDRAQTQGVLLLAVLVTPRMPEFDGSFIAKCSYLGQHCWPVKFCMHVLNCLPKAGKKRYAVQEAVTTFVGRVIENFAGDVEVHFEREEGQLYQELVDQGLSHQGIPAFLGGAWTFDQFQHWCRRRVIEEQRMHRSSGLLPVPAGGAKRRTPQERQTTNVLYSRRKRARDRKEFTSLKEERENLTKEQTMLVAENKRLKGLLWRARCLLVDEGIPVDSALFNDQRTDAGGNRTTTAEEADAKPAAIPRPTK